MTETFGLNKPQSVDQDSGSANQYCRDLQIYFNPIICRFDFRKCPRMKLMVGGIRVEEQDRPSTNITCSKCGDVFSKKSSLNRHVSLIKKK
jgi:hypothetical protein